MKMRKNGGIRGERGSGVRDQKRERFMSEVGGREIYSWSSYEMRLFDCGEMEIILEIENKKLNLEEF